MEEYGVIGFERVPANLRDILSRQGYNLTSENGKQVYEHESLPVMLTFQNGDSQRMVDWNGSGIIPSAELKVEYGRDCPISRGKAWEISGTLVDSLDALLFQTETKTFIDREDI